MIICHRVPVPLPMSSSGYAFASLLADRRILGECGFGKDKVLLWVSGNPKENLTVHCCRIPQQNHFPSLLPFRSPSHPKHWRHACRRNASHRHPTGRVPLVPWIQYAALAGSSQQEHPKKQTHDNGNPQKGLSKRKLIPKRAFILLASSDPHPEILTWINNNNYIVDRIE